MLMVQPYFLQAKKLVFVVSILIHTRIASFDVRSFCLQREVTCRHNIPKLQSSKNEVNHGDNILNVLSYIESLSPSKRIGQRVGCILQINNSALVIASNTFVNNVGVHAEMSAISKYLNIFPIPESPVVMTVSLSPCVECATLIQFIPEIKVIQYVHEFEDDGIDILKRAFLTVREIGTKNTQTVRKKGLKLHSYSRTGWDPKVTQIILSQEKIPDDLERGIIITHSASVAFDIRPFIVLAFRRRDNGSSILHLSYTGILNHREKLFANILGVCVASEQ